MMIRFSPNIAIQVTDPKKASDFYRNHLGFVFHENKNGEVKMVHGPITFWFEEGTPAKGTFFEFSTDDFKTKYADLIQNGCTETTRYSDTSVVLRDQFGLTFHLFEEKTNFRGSFHDTMIPAKSFAAMATFYETMGHFEVSERNEDFIMLTDAASCQKLCITNGPSITSTSPGFKCDDLVKTLNLVEKHGGKITKRWEYGPMKGANCTDPEGNELMCWSVTKKVTT